MLARGVHVPEALLASLAVVAIFSVLPVVDLPVGMITADEPGRMPLYLIEPILLAVIATPTCFSAAATLEATGSRAARLFHALIMSLLVLVVCAGLALQPNIEPSEVPKVTVTYLGVLGMMLLGASVLGALGWLVPLAYLLLLSVTGASGFGEPYLWAWSIRPLSFAAPVAGVLLAAGALSLGVRWHRATANE